MDVMTQPPRLTDRAALTRNRLRADAMFLQAAAADDVHERLIEVNRTFTAPVVVTGFPDAWSEWMPNATVIQDDETLDLEEGAHDLVIHALSLHWADDPIGQLVQCRRALKPDGILIATSFAGQTLHDAALPPGEKNPIAHSKQPVATSPYWPAAHPAQLVAFIVNAVVHSKHRTDGFRELLK